MHPRITIFLFPFAGASVNSMNGLKRHLPKQFDFKSLELPGRGSRAKEPLLYTMEEVLDDLFIQITPYLRDPFVFFGHSMGTSIAYLMVLRLLRRGLPIPEHCFFSGRAGLQEKQDQLLIHKMSQENFWKTLHRFGGLPNELLNQPSLKEFFEPVLRADLQVIENINMNRPTVLPLSIDLSLGSLDNNQPPQDLHWKCLFRECKITEYEGGHFFIFQHMDSLATQIADRMQALYTGL